MTDPAPAAEWVFGYGSLMWNPGFVFVERQAARLPGYHRAFCILSHLYRGTPEVPGLVLGLSAGGACQGAAFRVAPPDWDATVAYLDERELIGYAYRPIVLPVEGAMGTVDAYTFVADTGHPNFSGDLGVEAAAEMIMKAEGVAGLNRDYLMNTVRQLEQHGYEDAALHALLNRVETLTGIIDQGGGI